MVGSASDVHDEINLPAGSIKDGQRLQDDELLKEKKKTK
jgi:hypothetical protein